MCKIHTYIDPKHEFQTTHSLFTDLQTHIANKKWQELADTARFNLIGWCYTTSGISLTGLVQ